MLAERPDIAEDFPPVSFEAWRALVEQDLGGAPFEKKLVKRTYEGVDVQPLYAQRDRREMGDDAGFRVFAKFVPSARAIAAAHSSWDLRQEHANPDVTAANRAILDDLDGGATSVLLHFDAASRCGLDPDDPAAGDLAGKDGIACYTVDDVATLLQCVALNRVGIALDAGAGFLAAAALVASHWQLQGVAFSEARGAFNADPWSELAKSGRLPMSTQAAECALADLAVWTAKNLPHVTAVGVDTSAYHEAGATAAQDLAFGMATAVQYLRAMAEAGLDIDDACRQIAFRVSLGTHHFLAIAKLRAARLLWHRVVDASGGSTAASSMHIDARLSYRVLTERDPYVNILRNTAGVFAACIGGADAITSLPFDHLAGIPSEAGRRLARNTVLILLEEANLYRVADPASGSWFLDTVTEQLAKEAWTIFQDVERRGGMLAGLQSGWIAEQIDAAFAKRAKNIATRKDGITGVSEFPSLRENENSIFPSSLQASSALAAAKERVREARRRCTIVSPFPNQSSAMDAAILAAAQGATVGQLATAIGLHSVAAEGRAIKPRSFARPFEDLRRASDAWQLQHGTRPRVFLANMGPATHHTARTTYARNFFEAGGFEVIAGIGYLDVDAAVKAFVESGANIAVVCSSDQMYDTFVSDLAPKLRDAGARRVVLAGNPGSNEARWREAGVDRFIFIKCDVLEVLQAMLREEGVLQP